MYQFIRVSTTRLIKKIYDFDGEKAIMLYEFYTELIYYTKIMKLFVEFDWRINSKLERVKIEYFVIDEKFNTSVEKFNYTIRNNFFQNKQINISRMLNQVSFIVLLILIGSNGFRKRL